MTSQTPGQRFLRTALLAEAGTNIFTVIPMFVAPGAVLSYLVKSPSQITPLSKSLVQWTGAMLTLVTAPLLLAYPDPTDPVDPSQRATVLARRRLTYTFVAISEAGFVATTAWQYLAGGSGMTDGALLTATALVAGFGLARSFVLVGKPEWMEPSSVEKKTR